MNQLYIPMSHHKPTRRKRIVSARAIPGYLKFKEQLHNEQPYCVYCGVSLRLHEATVDHVVPKSKGGTDDKTNLVIACNQCNQLKGDRLIQLPWFGEY